MSEETEDLQKLLTEEPKEEKKEKFDRLKVHFFSKFKNQAEIDEWRKQAAKKRRITWEQKNAKRNELIARANEIAPEVLANDMITKELGGENWTPRQELIDKMGYILKHKKALTIHELRTKFFKTVEDETWHKLMKFVFKSKFASGEDLGLQLEQDHENARALLKKRISMVKRQIKVWQEENPKNGMPSKTIPLTLMKMLAETEDQLLEFSMDISKTLVEVQAVGEKSKAPSLHVHVTAPRPPKREEKIVGSQD